MSENEKNVGIKDISHIQKRLLAVAWGHFNAKFISTSDFNASDAFKLRTETLMEMVLTSNFHSDVINNDLTSTPLLSLG